MASRQYHRLPDDALQTSKRFPAAGQWKSGKTDKKILDAITHFISNDET